MMPNPATGRAELENRPCVTFTPASSWLRTCTGEPARPMIAVVCERWALLVIRELLLGPQRFSDLRHALPAASSNLVADRLRELQGRGVIHRRKLPAPAAS